MRKKDCLKISCENNIKNVKFWLFCISIIPLIQAAEVCIGENCLSSSLNTHKSKWAKKTRVYNDLNENSGNSIMDFLEDQIDILPFANYRELVFVFGADHTDKTTLVLFLTDADLVGVETAPNSGKFVHVDRDGPYTEYAPNIDSNIIPGLIPNKESGIEYYILPQADVQTDVKHDITGVHLKQRLLKYASGVKFLFTLSYDCVKEYDNTVDAYNAREEIRELVRNATDLIRDIDKYNVSFALVVTNVEYYPDTTDAKEKKMVVSALDATASEFADYKNKYKLTPEELIRVNKYVTFLEILVQLDYYTGDYPRIGIFRAPNKPGPVSDMELVQDGKYFIRHMIREYLVYAPREDTDFYYNITNESRDRIQEIVEVTQERLSDDMLTINSDLRDIHVKFEEDFSEIKVLFEKMDKGLNAVSQIDATEPKMFVKQVLKAANTLEIKIPTGNINTILKHIEFMDFALDVERIRPKKIFQFKNGVDETETYLEESKGWYSYLLDLHDILSEYVVQKNVTDYQEDVALIMERTIIERDEYRNVTDIGLIELLEKINKSLPPSIQNLTVNFWKLQKLSAVLYRTMIDQATPFCSPGKIVVKGYNIKISSYNEMECPGDLKFIEIFASNNLFIDGDIDKSGEQVQLFFIAPTWEIIGKRKFLLNGIDAEPIRPTKALDGNRTSVDGKIGIPGNPGGSAGCFLAIGNKYINDENLEIQLNGGRGGYAQEGGDGYRGIKGRNPDMPLFSFQTIPTWNKKGFESEKLFEITIPSIFGFAAILYLYEAVGKKAQLPGAGANGGLGGIGGNAGQTFLVGLEGDPKFRVVNETGRNGTSGNGGIGGAGTYDGDTYTLGYRDAFFVAVIFIPFGLCMHNKPGKWYPQGADGIRGANDEDIEQPLPSRFINPAYSINSYKSYLRENIVNSIQESRLMEFMVDFELDKRVQNLYDTMGLFDDLKSLENQYLQLRNSLSFLPFHESLLNRTGEYANSQQVGVDQTKVLRFIYTAAAGKISNLRNFRQHVLIIDLQEYLQIVEKNINKLGEIQKEVNILEQKKQYQDMLNDKIKSAFELVNKEVIPALLKYFADLSNDIPKLVADVAKRGNSTQVQTLSNSGTQWLQRLQDAIRKYKIANVLRLVARFASFFGRTGDVVAKYISTASSALDAYSTVNIESLVKGLQSTFANVVEFLKGDFYVYIEQLHHISWLITGFPPCYDDVRKFINETLNDILGIFTSDSPYTYLQDTIEKKRADLKELLSEANRKCPFSGANTYNDKQKAETARQTNDIQDIDEESFKEIKNDTSQVITYAKEEKASAKEMESWQTRLKMIRSKLIPMFADMQATIVMLVSSLENKTAVELDVTAWKVQTVVGDIKLLFHQMSEGTTLQDDLQRNMEKIGETFAVLIKIYDRVQSYMDQSKFAEYLANIQSPNSIDISDPRLREVVLQVKLVIQTNLVLDQYQIAIHSFKQHQFPFAHIHLATFDLPTGLEANDTRTIVSRAVEEISYLQELTKFLAISIGKFDRDVFGDIDFNSKDGRIAVPFYTFKSREYKYEVKRLLNGEETMINADIRNAFNQNAVKFNNIGIQFKLVNGTEELQSELDTVLEKYFGVRMTMIGHNYYRCGNQFYYLSVDDNLVIEYSFKKNQDGKPVKFNDVYHKLDGKDYFLSPYAIWQVQLVKIMDDFPSNSYNDTIARSGFNALNKFKDETINIELYGRGQYLRADSETSEEVCTDEVGKYYFSDDFTMEIDDIENTRMIYLL